MIGTIVVNEVILPIVGVELVAGEIRFVGYTEGHVPDFKGGYTDMSLRGTDGIMVAELRRTMEPWTDAHSLMIIFPLRLTEVTAVTK